MIAYANTEGRSKARSDVMEGLHPPPGLEPVSPITPPKEEVTPMSVDRNKWKPEIPPSTSGNASRSSEGNSVIGVTTATKSTPPTQPLSVGAKASPMPPPAGKHRKLNIDKKVKDEAAVSDSDGSFVKLTPRKASSSSSRFKDGSGVASGPSPRSGDELF